MFKRAVHPGEVLRDELAEFGITPTAFARQIDVPPNRVSQIIAGKRFQTQFDLATAEQRAGAAVREFPTAAAGR